MVSVKAPCPGSGRESRANVGDINPCPVCGKDVLVWTSPDGKTKVIPHLRTDPYRGLPQVMPNEDGEIAWAPGHVPAHLFVRAAIRNARVDGWEDGVTATLRERGIRGTVASVIYHWMKPDPTNEERYNPCEPTDPRAGPFTSMDIEW